MHALDRETIERNACIWYERMSDEENQWGPQLLHLSVHMEAPDLGLHPFSANPCMKIMRACSRVRGGDSGFLTLPVDTRKRCACDAKEED